MEALKKSRETIKGSMKRIVTFITTNSDANDDVLQVRLSRAKDLLDLFTSVENQMFRLEEKVPSEIAEFEEDYYTAVSFLNARLRKLSLKESMDNSTLNNTLNASQQQFGDIRLPKICIPTFSGDYMQWQSFFDLYSVTIHEKEGLTAAQKFQYLKSLLKGEAESLIRNFSVTEANYYEAFQRLCKRYDRKRHTVSAFIKTFLDQTGISHATASNIRKLMDTSDEVIRGLKALGPEAEKRDPWLLYIILNKLDEETRNQWALNTTETEFPTFDELLKFLAKHTDALESLGSHTRKASHKNTTKMAFATNTNPMPNQFSCPLCQEDHKIFMCARLKEMDTNKRLEYLKKSGRCFNCLSGTHRVTDCRVKTRCQICHRKHSTLIHSDKGLTITPDNQNSQEASSTTVASTSQNYKTNCEALTAVLPTAVVLIKGQDNSFIKSRALLDSCSQASFISETLVQKLKLPKRNGRVLIEGLGREKIGQSKGITEITISSKENHKLFITDAYIVPQITTNLPSLKLGTEVLSEFKKLNLADSGGCGSSTIDILLGVDIFFKCLKSGKIDLPNKLVAVETDFGWILAGTPHRAGPSSLRSFNILTDIDRNLRLFWEIEEVLKKPRETIDDNRCEELFKATTFRGNDMKFTVRLPFRTPAVLLGSSYHQALSRLYSMERKFKRNAEFQALYVQFMEEYERLGHMKYIPGPPDQKLYYLPHHGVEKASSSTTKLRVVFDGSTKSQGGVSINDVLMKGPSVQSPLVEILIRFRQHVFVVTGDVEKMYRQVWVSEKDSELQNILWRPHYNAPVRRYCLKTVTYGTASAAYLATRSIIQVARNIRSEFPNAAKSIEKDTYVDDLMTGANTIEELQDLIVTIRNCLEKHGFHLRKFLSNNVKILRCLREPDNLTSKLINNNEDIKILGLSWNPGEDTFGFTSNLTEIGRHTKRTLLSEASKNFDPLGWLSPLTIKVKILFQALWVRNIEWDDELPKDILEEWLKIRQEYSKITQIKIDRWIKTTTEFTIHGFSDASENAYAAAVYGVAGGYSTLIAAKSKVAPVKQLSIPRLELLGALLLSKLMTLIERANTMVISQRVLWTDSQIVLDWLSAHPRRWSTFVGNRTSEIIDIYPRKLWRHIPSKHNPADLASRGIPVDELAKSTLWWNGPILIMNPDLWSIPSQTDTVTEIEIKSSTFKNTIASETLFDVIINKFSCFFRMTKVLALILSFIDNIKAKKQGNIIKTSMREQLLMAERLLIKAVQHAEFKAEIEHLKTDKPIQNSSSILSLNPFLDGDGLIRVGGRIQKSLAPFHVKHPVVLPYHSNLSRVIVEHMHVTYYHAGVTLLTSLVKRKYWIVKARLLVRRIVRSCVTCVRYSPLKEKQIMGNLPASRVNLIHPFNEVGVDYCGPFHITPIRRRGGQIIMKAYICIFVCMSTKCVHMEVAGNLTTEGFLGAFQRFVARRGICKTIVSDNGTNFVGANNQLIELYKFILNNESEISSFLSLKKIDWQFIPPGSPHMGGIWEAAVKQAKVHLKRVVGDVLLTFEEFNTLIIQIEALLNSRPICASMCEDIDVLTPAHFLIGRTFTDIADGGEKCDNITPNTRWHIIKQIRRHFWQRWHRDYLTSLQRRNKWNRKTENIQIGDVVLLRDDNVAPAQWPLGRVTNVHDGNDGQVRVVSIKSADTGKIIKRTIHKLIRLPIQDIESGDSMGAKMLHADNCAEE